MTNTITHLLTALRAAGLTLRASGGKLLVSPSALASQHADVIRANRDALLAALADEEATVAAVAAFPVADGGGHRGGPPGSPVVAGDVGPISREEAGTWVGWCRVSPGRWQPVVTAASYAEAWRLLQQHRPAAVTCDKWVGKEGVKP